MFQLSLKTLFTMAVVSAFVLIGGCESQSTVDGQSAQGASQPSVEVASTPTFGAGDGLGLRTFATSHKNGLLPAMASVPTD